MRTVRGRRTCAHRDPQPEVAAIRYYTSDTLPFTYPPGFRERAAGFGVRVGTKRVIQWAGPVRRASC